MYIVADFQTRIGLTFRLEMESAPFIELFECLWKCLHVVAVLYILCKK